MCATGHCGAAVPVDRYRHPLYVPSDHCDVSDRHQGSPATRGKSTASVVSARTAAPGSRYRAGPVS